MASRGIDVQLKNSQELIVTDNNYTNATVKFSITNKNIEDFFSKTANR